MKYWVLDHGRNDGVYLTGLKTKIKDWRFSQGEKLAKEFPKNASFSFSSKWPDRRKLYDFLNESFFGVMVVSERVKTILEELEAKDLEFLPVTVKDHKNNPVDGKYFILNPLGRQDAIDFDKSKVVMGAILEDEVDSFDKLVINPKGIAKGARLFRLNKARRVIVIDEDVRKAFRAQGITGFSVYKADGWDGLPSDSED